MSIVFLALGTTRARAVCASARFLVERGVHVDLITVEEGPWRAEGLDERVRVLTLSTRADKYLLPNKLLKKFYWLVRPYVMWRAARRQALNKVDWDTVQQAVISDSHAIPIGWHLARRHPKLAVGFELDRTPYLDLAGAAAATNAASAAGTVSAGSDPAPVATGTP
jgi:hypothetical protein